MDIKCRPMTVDDYGQVECAHWSSAEQVAEYISRQGIASMLAFVEERCVGQLYLQEYDPAFREPAGWQGDRPWADFSPAEPLGLAGRFLTLGCYHVGWRADGSRDPSLCGQGIGKALLEAVLRWYDDQDEIDGLMAWGLVTGSWELLQWAGQMPHPVYRRYGFQEVKAVRDRRLNQALANVHTNGTPDPPALLRVMVLAPELPELR